MIVLIRSIVSEIVVVGGIMIGSGTIHSAPLFCYGHGLLRYYYSGNLGAHSVTSIAAAAGAGAVMSLALLVDNSSRPRNLDGLRESSCKATKALRKDVQGGAVVWPHGYHSSSLEAGSNRTSSLDYRQPCVFCVSLQVCFSLTWHQVVRVAKLVYIYRAWLIWGSL